MISLVMRVYKLSYSCSYDNAEVYADGYILRNGSSRRFGLGEAHLRDEDIYWGSMLCALEMIKSGTTTFADMYFYMDQTARAVQRRRHLGPAYPGGMVRLMTLPI